MALLTWLGASRGRRSSSFLRGLEVTTFVGVSGLYMVLASTSSAVGKPDQTITLALTLALIGRCIYIPSSVGGTRRRLARTPERLRR